jgi:threonine aldolase
MIDLRSDTVTRPSRARREAMLSVEVGDDMYGEDPTVNALQERAAQLLGKEAALLVSSGIQGNLVALLAHAPHGSEVILGELSHINWWERNGMATLGGLMPRVVPDVDGAPLPADVERAIRARDLHAGETALVCLENTHADRGGIPVPLERMAAIAEVAHRHQLPVHVDGARIFNAATALGLAACELVAPVDSVTFCLSKGLGAPVGSLLCGSAAFIERARNARKILGGAMRQVGWIAVAGSIALDQHVERLAGDHQNALLLGELLREVRGLRLSPAVVYTNMVFVDVTDTGFTPAQITERLAERDVAVLPFDERRLRLVTHLDVDRAAIERAAEAFAQVASSASPALA